MKFLLILAVFISNYASASSVSVTQITRVLVGPQYGNKVILAVSTKAADIPSCQTNSRYNYVFDGTTAVGKITLSVVLAAYAAQKDVWLGGGDNCSLHNVIESLKHIVAL